MAVEMDWLELRPGRGDQWMRHARVFSQVWSLVGPSLEAHGHADLQDAAAAADTASALRIGSTVSGLSPERIRAIAAELLDATPTLAGAHAEEVVRETVQNVLSNPQTAGSAHTGFPWATIATDWQAANESARFMLDEIYDSSSTWMRSQFNGASNWLEVSDVVRRARKCNLECVRQMAREYQHELMVAAALAIASLVLYLLFYCCCARRRPQMYTQHLPGHATQLPPKSIDIDTDTTGPLNAVYETVHHGKFADLIARPYAPTFWLTWPKISGHLQTIFTARATPSWLGTPLLTYTREIIRVAATAPQLQHGEVALDWAVLGKARRSPSASPVHEFHTAFTSHTPTVLICHGLAGGGSEHYVKNTCFHLSSRLGYRCVVFNARGCGGSRIINNQLYCGAYTEDLRQVVASLRQRLPHAPLLAVGFSLGANILSKFVGEEGLAGRSPFAALCVLANPFDFLLGSKALDATWTQRAMYSTNLAKNLIQLFKTHLDVLDAGRVQALARENGVEPLDLGLHHGATPPYNLDEVFAAPTLREFDKRLTAPIFGYSTVDDYYRDASSSKYIKFIRSPALLLSALDDPISPRAAIPYDEACINPYVTLVTTHAGGHSMDWYTGSWHVRSWSVEAVCTFFEEILSRTPTLDGVRAQPIETPPTHVHTTDDDDESASFEEEADDAEGAEDGELEARSWRTAGSSAAASPESPLVDSVQQAIELQAKLDAMEHEVYQRRVSSGSLFDSPTE